MLGHPTTRGWVEELACSTVNNFDRALSHVSLPRDNLTPPSDAPCLLQVLLQTPITFHSAQNLLKTIFPPLLPQHGQPSCQNVVSHTVPEKAQGDSCWLGELVRKCITSL